MAGPNIPLLPNELARLDGGRFQLRPGPMRLKWTLDGLVTSDGHEVRCEFGCAIRALEEPSELKMLEEVFLGRTHSVRAEAVVAHFTPGLRSAAGNVAAKQKAQAMIGDESARQELVAALQKEGARVAFTAGLEFLAPFEVRVESASYRAQRIEEMERMLAERRMAGQVEHFEKAAGLLKRFDELRKSNPELSPADVLKLITPADQGTMLQTLMLASGRADSTRMLWAVTGNSVVRVDPRATPASIEAMAMPEGLGPLRSIQPAKLGGKDVMLVGARSGVIVFDPAEGTMVLLADRGTEYQLGFSAAVVWREQVWACHGEAGVVGWNPDAPAAPVMAVRPAELRKIDNPPPVPTEPSPPTYNMTAGGVVASMAVRTAGIRNVTALDEERLVFSVGHELVVIDSKGGRKQIALANRAEILAVVPDGKRVLLAQEDGTVSVLDGATLGVQAQQRRAGRLAAAARLPWLGASRLLLASEEGPIYCVGPDDEVVTQFMSNHRGLRAITAAADLVAAVSPDRQRVIVWPSWDGKKPIAEIGISAITRHRVGDVEFA